MIRLMTYNIHGCVGLDRRKSPERVLEVLNESGADVIALQEVHNETRRDRTFLEDLSDLPYKHILFDPTLKRKESDYGNVLLSRYPFNSTERLDISKTGREPRGAIIASIQADGFCLRVIATHLGLGFGERHEQLKTLMPAIRKHEERSREHDVHVLMGDINEWRDWGKPIRLCETLYERAPKVRTFPACLPLFSLDRIWLTPAARLHSIHAMRTNTSRSASDHLPLVAEIT